MSRSAATESNRRRYSLIITGQRHNRRRRVVAKGHDGWLSDMPFETLCELAYAKAQGHGSVAIPRAVVGRIREAFGEPPCASGVPSLIQCVAKGRYVLLPPHREIALHQSFLKQPATELRPRYRGRVIRRAYRVVKLA
jgi:hypothetical protein